MRYVLMEGIECSSLLKVNEFKVNRRVGLFTFYKDPF